jgi:hypothetical protein
VRSAALLTLALALAACGGDGDAVGTESPVGSWRLEDPVRYSRLVARLVRQRAARDGTRSETPFDEAEHTEKMRKHVLTFAADGSFQDTDGTETAIGTWVRDGNQVRARWRPVPAGAPENHGTFELAADGFHLVQSALGGGPPRERFRLVRAPPSSP